MGQREVLTVHTFFRPVMSHSPYMKENLFTSRILRSLRDLRTFVALPAVR